MNPQIRLENIKKMSKLKKKISWYTGLICLWMIRKYGFLWSESNQRLITCFLGQEVPIKPFSYNLLVFVDFLGRSSKSWNSRTDIPLLDIKWREMAHYGTSFAKIMLFEPFSINVLPPPWPLLFSLEVVSSQKIVLF